MKHTILLSVFLSASVGFAAPAKKTAVNKAKATPKVAALDTKPVTVAASTTGPVAPDTATVTNPSTASAIAIQPPSNERITGVLEMRPTATAKGPNNFTTENTLGLGYQFNPNFEIGAVQYIDTNVRSSKPSRTGADVIIQDSFIRAKFNNIYQTEKLSFGFEPRVYLPTRAAFRDAGGITFIRNYFKLAYKASSAVTLSFMELPIPYFSSRAGTGTTANIAFENRLYFIADFDLGKGFAFSLPLFFHQTKNRDFAPAARGGKWDHFVYTWPELTYAVAPNATIGVAFYTDNFLTADNRGLDIANGFAKGAFQAILGLSL